MAIVAVAGDCCSTTSVALAAGWPSADRAVLVESDPSGGDLAAWFDMPESPSLSTVVTRVLSGAWQDIEPHTRHAASGTVVIPAPSSVGEATQAVFESGRSVAPALAAIASPVAIADTGRLASVAGVHPFVAAAAIVVVVHRQATQSARAAAVRLQRLVEHLDSLAVSPTSVVVAVVGGAPFGLGEIERFVRDEVGETAVVGLPADPLAAAVLAGRTGVSARRLARLPLMRAGRDLAERVRSALTESMPDQGSDVW